MDFKDNKLFIELDRQSKIDYNIYLELFNYNKINNNESDIHTFIDFLFSDIIKIDSSKIDQLENIAKDITLSQDYFNNYISNILSNNNDDLIVDEIKVRLGEKNKTLLKKISECKDHLKIIRQYYLNIKISEKIPNNENKNKELIFPSKSVLFIQDKKKMLRIGEIFTRYLFIIASNKKKNTNQNKNLIEFDKSEPEKFYNQDNNNISNFDEWSDSMKYFLVILLLIDLLFNSSSNYKIIFNNKSLKESITELSKNEKKQNKKSDKNKKFNSKLLDIFKGTKQRGLKGGLVKNYSQKKEFKPKTEKSAEFKPKTEKSAEFKPKTNNKKKNNKNKVSLRTKLDNILKDTEINTPTKTLLSFYDIKFKNKMLEYFKEEIKKKFYKKNINSNIKDNKNVVNKDIKFKIHNITIINPFHTAAKDKPEKLSEYLDIVIKNNKKKETDYNFIELSAFLKSHFKYNIYNFLYFFKDSQYENKLFNFIKKIKMKVLLLLFSLYIKKKYLYEAFINATSQIISINDIKLDNSLKSEKKNTGESENPYINQEEKDKYSSKKKINKSKRIEKDVLNKLNNKNKSEYVKINSNIKLIKKKIAILDEKYFNNVNYDIKKMQLEKIYHRLIIQKRDILNI